MSSKGAVGLVRAMRLKSRPVVVNADYDSGSVTTTFTDWMEGFKGEEAQLPPLRFEFLKSK